MIFIKAFFFGLTLALAIGPMALLMVQRCIAKGLRSGVVTALGIAIADATFGIIGFSIGAPVLRFADEYEVIIQAFSGSILISVAIYLIFVSFAMYRNRSIHAARAAGGDFISSYILAMHNPLAIALFLGFLGHLTDAPRSIVSILFLTFIVCIGSFTGQLLIVVTGFSLRKFIQRPKTILICNIASALSIAAFGVANLARLIV